MSLHGEILLLKQKEQLQIFGSAIRPIFRVCGTPNEAVRGHIIQSVINHIKTAVNELPPRNWLPALAADHR
jgi:hypothetical protein